MKKLIICFIFLISAVMPFPVKAEENAIDVPVIMYHSLDAKARDIWTLSPAEFEKDLEYLAREGYTAVLLEDLVNYVENGSPLPEKPIVLTFDDCYYNNYLYAYPLMEKYDMKMVISIIGAYSQQYSEEEDVNPTYAHLSWQTLKEMQDSGRVELANHSWDLHTSRGKRDGCCIMKGESMDSYSQFLQKDVMKLQETLTAECGKAPLCFTYPFGSKCPEALSVLRGLGFKVTLSCYEGMNHIKYGDTESLYDMRRINRSPSKPLEQILG